MDYMLPKEEECESREDFFDPKLIKYNTDFMLDNWSPNSMDLMDSIFDTDLLNFDEIDNLSKQNIIEPETYLTANPTNISFENVLSSSCVTESPISSNSSDSGLSSDNLETDISPEYEPFSPAISSPGPSISERGEKNSPSRNNEMLSSPYLEHFITAPLINLKQEKLDDGINQIQVTQQQQQQQQQQMQQQKQQQSGKVIVQKIPQIINLPTKRTLAQSTFENNIKEKEIKIVKISPQPFNISKNKKMATIQVKNPNTDSKIQSKPGTLLINNKGNVTEVKKFIPVHTTSNPRSILLPVTVQDMKGIKAYKVFNVSTLKNYSNNTKKIPTTVPLVKPVQESPKIIKKEPKVKEEQYSSEYISDVDSLILEDDIKHEDTTDGFIEECDDIEDESIDYTSVTTGPNTTDSPYPKLILSAEEKRLLAKEGITLPSHYPLTKYEERELKRIRRKIRNKISAQDSRKRKKEYVDGLEERVKQCTEENQTLIKKIKLLQTQNQNLMSQMKKLQALLSKGTNKTAHPTTCLMVLLLSLALVATPNLKFGQNPKENELNEFAQDAAATAADVLQNRRNLLFDAKDHYNNDIFDEDLNVNDFITANEIAMNNGGNSNNGNGGLSDFIMNFNCKLNNDSNNEPVCKKPKNVIDFDVDDTNWYQQTQETQKIQQQQEKKLQKTVYDLAAETYQKNKSQQTSGFNIKETGYADDNILNENIVEMMAKRSNPGLYEINIEKFGGSMDVTATATAGSNVKVSE